MESPYLLDLIDFMGCGVFRSLSGAAFAYLARYIIPKEIDDDETTDNIIEFGRIKF